MLTRRNFSWKAVAAASAVVFSPVTFAQIAIAKLTIGFPPGAAFDAFTRRTADRLRGTLASAVIVENKAGAGGQIAVTTVRDSASDGSNILVSPSSLFSIHPFTHKTLPYKVEELKPVATGVFLEPALAIGPAVPETVKTLKDFIAWTKQNPVRGTYASPGAGSMLHMVGAYVSKVSGLDWLHVAHRGAAPAIQDLLSGQVSAAILPLGEFQVHIKSGKIRVLVISSNERSKFMPEVPTLRQLGIPISAREWYGFYLPASASPEVVRKTAAHLQTALMHPDMAAWAESMYMDLQFKGPDETAALLETDREEWRHLIKVVGFTADS